MVTMLTFTNSVDIPEPVESSIWREQETICHFSTPSTSALSPSLQLDLGMWLHRSGLHNYLWSSWYALLWWYCLSRYVVYLANGTFMYLLLIYLLTISVRCVESFHQVSLMKTKQKMLAMLSRLACIYGKQNHWCSLLVCTKGNLRVTFLSRWTGFQWLGRRFAETSQLDWQRNV